MHESELGKLNRISGQIEGIKKMIAEHRDCPDILTQLRATRAAIRAVEANILESHLQSCVTESLASGNARAAQKKIEELKDLFKRFDAS
ncbi:MAG: metal-sensitive transcriptional regulator [Micavibrio aeruginosavorus]|nr:metal-sensitive transcriptional regulator [Micavibrio aeruginosavorus]